MRFYILLAFCILFTGCPGGGDSFPWHEQPHQDIVPLVFGKWDISPTVYMDVSRVYGYPDSQAPSWILPAVKPLAERHLTGVIAYAKARNHTVKRIMSPDRADIVVRFYYGEYVYDANVRLVAHTVPDGMLLSLDPMQFCGGLIELGDSSTSVAEKSTSTTIEPPPREANYNGLVKYHLKKKRIQDAEMWVNLAALQHYSDVAEQVPAFDLDSAISQYVHKLFWHESGHAFYGLQDDVAGAKDADGNYIPGAMSYPSMKAGFSTYEGAVIRWLYLK